MTVAAWIAALVVVVSPAKPAPSPTMAEKVAPAAPFWAFRDGRLTHVPTGMTFPERVGAQSFNKIGIISHHGEGLDDGLEWQTPGRDSFTTIFVFQPSLADAGLAAEMTDTVVRRAYGEATRAYDDRIVAVGGKPGVARRVLYQGPTMHGRAMWSGAATMKVGSWLIGVRLSGPAAKKAELEAEIDGLLADLHFSETTPPRPFHSIAFTDCPARPDRPAAKAAAVKPIDAGAFGLGTMALDGRVVEQRDGQSFSSQLTRVPDRLCRAPIGIGNGRGLRLWPADDNAGGFAITRFAELILVDDAGKIIEVSKINKPVQPWYVTLHFIGGAEVITALEAQ